VKLKVQRFVPLVTCAAVIALVGLSQFLTYRVPNFDIFRRLEWMTYDWRARQAARPDRTVNAPNLGFVFIDDESIETLIGGRLDYKVGLYWPRHVYGRLIQELSFQGAEAVGFDILFPELRPDHPPAVLPAGTEASDDFFIRQMQAAGNVILAADKGVLPDQNFRDAAWAVGDVGAQREADGILRRVKPFESYRIRHPLIRNALSRQAFLVESNRIVFTGEDRKEVVVPVDPEGNFDQAVLYELLSGNKPPPNVAPISKAFTEVRVWDLGIVLAARHLGLDLNKAIVEPGKRIFLQGDNGEERVIPIDEQGRMYVDWSITPFDRKLTKESIHSLLLQEQNRRLGQTNDLVNLWRNKLVVVGSVATGNDLTDFGATPIDKETYLISRIWNVANSVILGRFIRKSSPLNEFLFTAAMALIAGIITWKLRGIWAALLVLSLGASYFGCAAYAYIDSRFWLPLVFPLGGLFFSHFSLITYRAVFEQKERRRIRGIFDKIVSPNIVNELLHAEKLSLEGARREVTVFFADVRGFTEMTDVSHDLAEEYVRKHHLEGEAAKAYLEDQAQEVLGTVNLYLSTIADVIKRHEGTLDKYIGDCVMAFWGAPTPQEHHALAAVRAAIDAQRAVYALNQERAAENKRREPENLARAAHGERPLPMFNLLALGTGINTGMVTVGLMGSHSHIVNYTVFGREVNVAARLEGVSGRGRIIIGEGTYRKLQRDDPALALGCVEMAPVTVKGIREPVKIFEVPWKGEMIPTAGESNAEPPQPSEPVRTGAVK
jgi:class 3 adenylate cyclase/CHASE2 domain-containing sensor protein